MRLGSSGSLHGLRTVIANFYVTNPDNINLVKVGTTYYNIEVNGKLVESTYAYHLRGRYIFSAKEYKNNPVPEGASTKLDKAKRRYKSFRDQEDTGTYKLSNAPKYHKDDDIVGECVTIDYTTYRGEDNNKEKYRHDFVDKCCPLIAVTKDGYYWSYGGLFRFTYRGFLDQPTLKTSKAVMPPFCTGLVIGYLDALYIKPKPTGRVRKLSFIAKKVLLCSSESGYNFFTVSEP